MQRDINNPKPPSMDRSKVQLSTSYGPGALFTFEGNLVACEAVPYGNYPRVEIEEYSKDQIFRRIEEITSSWYQQAFHCRDRTPDAPPVVPRMCIDRDLLRADFTGLDQLRRAKFEFVEPGRMGYRPTLLTMVCNRCKRVKTFFGPKDFYDRRDELDPINCPEQYPCDWRQMDVVFVHPNGNWTQALPGRYDWDDHREKVSYFVPECKKCGSREVKINDKTSQISKRHFLCAECGAKREDRWVQNEREMVEIFASDTRNRLHDVRMRPVSYRANSVYYVKSDVVIDFGRNTNLILLSPGHENELELFVANRFGFPVINPPEEKIEKQVKGLKDGKEKWNDYLTQKKSLESLETLFHTTKNVHLKPAIDNQKAAIDKIIETWRENGVITVGANIPAEIHSNLISRASLYDSRFDPFRLLVEHRALLETSVNDAWLSDGKRAFVPLDKLDEYIGPEDEEKREALNQEHRSRMGLLGMEEIGLIRNFKLLHFSFGYSRISASPITEHIGRTMPVRLKLFPKTTIDEDNKHPIYILQQDNEAIYGQLKEEHVREWLRLIQPREELSNDPLGAQVIKHFFPMTAYLDNLPSRGNPSEGPFLSLAVYTLLHTYAHHVMNAITDLSGLDISSMGEYIFPADLSFVVYRKGATTDLGNLSSMLRNNTPAFLDYLLAPHSLGCGAGTLCASRGGACPDCVMIPEVSCLAQNKLLSRSVLIGRDIPREGGFYGAIPGYLDVAQVAVSTGMS
jgi:hypothetical protein